MTDRVLSPLLIAPIDRETLRRFAHASGDRNPIHLDPEVARSIVGTIFSVANGSAFWRKSSYLVGKEGEVVDAEFEDLGEKK